MGNDNWESSTSPLSVMPRTSAGIFVCTLVCQNSTCQFLEFPGCSTHRCLLSSRKADGNGTCVSCSCATDRSSPWRHGCRRCRSPTKKVWLGFTRAEAAYGESGMSTLPDEVLHSVLHCHGCGMAGLPGTGGTLTVAVGGNDFVARDGRSLPPSSWSSAFEHTRDCPLPGNPVPLRVRLTKSEARYLNSTIGNTRSTLSSAPVADSAAVKYVCALVCSSDTCRFLEFPGCTSHSALLTVPKGSDHGKCRSCSTATDTASPWRHGCRRCRSPTHKLWWGVSKEEAEYLRTTISTDVKHAVLLCPACGVANFPGTRSGLTHAEPGACLIDSAGTHHDASDWSLDHVRGCPHASSGGVAAVACLVDMTVGEGNYLANTIDTTPLPTIAISPRVLPPDGDALQALATGGAGGATAAVTRDPKELVFVASIRCRACKLWELPGCAAHHVLLAERVSGREDAAKCSSCSVSTSTSQPWAGGCRRCRSATDVMFIGISTEEADYGLHGLDVDGVTHSLMVCGGCGLTRFPGTSGKLTHVGSEGPLTAHDGRQLDVSAWGPGSTHALTCPTPLATPLLVEVLLVKEELSFLCESIRRTASSLTIGAVPRSITNREEAEVPDRSETDLVYVGVQRCRTCTRLEVPVCSTHKCCLSVRTPGGAAACQSELCGVATDATPPWSTGCVRCPAGAERCDTLFWGVNYDEAKYAVTGLGGSVESVGEPKKKGGVLGTVRGLFGKRTARDGEATGGAGSDGHAGAPDVEHEIEHTALVCGGCGAVNFPGTGSSLTHADGPRLFVDSSGTAHDAGSWSVSHSPECGDKRSPPLQIRIRFSRETASRLLAHLSRTYSMLTVAPAEAGEHTVPIRRVNNNDDEDTAAPDAPVAHAAVARGNNN